MKKLLLLLLFSGSMLAQNYTVSPIPHQVYNAPFPIQETQDDYYSPVINLPFSFTFYGNNYNQIVISTNGYIDFRTQLAGAFSPWSFALSIPNTGFSVKNSILGCYHDLFNSTGSAGSITTATVGSAPYRKFVVFFNENAHYSCTNLKSSFQIVLYETYNFIDVQIISKEVCNSWNSGNAVTGVINNDGDLAVTPEGRNTGSWTAAQEGWRFKPAGLDWANYSFVKCDSDNDGFETFNLEVVKTDLNPSNPSSIVLYETITDVQNGTNAISTSNYLNIVSTSQTIYATGNGAFTTVVLQTVNCANDYDLDSVATTLEDLNNDTNLANDDTDADGIPNFSDNDDDGDMILTEVEYVFSNGMTSENNTLDTDGDGIPNYLDNDDDGDGVLTINEDYDHNNNPGDDDTNSNGIPDYLESTVTLQTDAFTKIAVLYPNPVLSSVNIQSANEAFTSVNIYNFNGALVKTVQKNTTNIDIDLSDLQTGVYLVKVAFAEGSETHKIIKK